LDEWCVAINGDNTKAEQYIDAGEGTLRRTVLGNFFEVCLADRTFRKESSLKMSSKTFGQCHYLDNDDDEKLISDAVRKLFNMELVTKVCARELTHLLSRLKSNRLQSTKSTLRIGILLHYFI
jgi:hypothetical protein